MDGTALTEAGHPGPERSPHTEARRILAVGNMYPPQHAGGYELLWNQAMRCARRLGHTVRILTSDYVDDAQRREQDPDVHRTLRWYWDIGRYEFPRLGLAERTRLERHNAVELRRHLKEFQPDVVAWWSMGCMSLSLIEQVRHQDIPAVFVVLDDWLVYGPEHDQWMRTWRGPKRQVAGWLAQRACRIPTRADFRDSGRWVFISRYTLDRAREVGLEAPSATVIHAGIEDQFLEPLESQPWRWRLVYVGRLDRQKGIDTAVTALAELPQEATLTIWGTGDDGYVAEMKELAERLGVLERVRFAGFAASERVRSAYQNADVVVFPVRWKEPFGLVPLEAMGLGRPVVATARGGAAEYLVDQRNALVFPADDAHALADRVRRLADDGSLRERLCKEGQETAARFPVARFARATVEEIVRAAGEPGCRVAPRG